MLSSIESAMPPTTQPRACLRSVQPSLLDLRFTGDPWVVDQQDGSATLRLNDYPLARIQTSPIDLPFLNQLFLQLRQWQMRRRRSRQIYIRARGVV